MGASMKCDKKSLALLSSKKTKAYTRSRADEAFALPSFSDPTPAASSRAKGDDPYSLPSFSGTRATATERAKGNDPYSAVTATATPRAKGDDLCSLPSFSGASGGATATATLKAKVDNPHSLSSFSGASDCTPVTVTATVRVKGDDPYYLPSFSAVSGGMTATVTPRAKGDGPYSLASFSGTSSASTASATERAKRDNPYSLSPFSGEATTMGMVKQDIPYSLPSFSGATNTDTSRVKMGEAFKVLSFSDVPPVVAARAKEHYPFTLPSFGDALHAVVTKAKAEVSPVVPAVATVAKEGHALAMRDMHVVTTKAIVDQAFALPSFSDSRGIKDQAFALPSFSDAMAPTTTKGKADEGTRSRASPVSGGTPVITSRMELLSPMASRLEHHSESTVEKVKRMRLEHHSESNVEKVKNTMLQHECVFKEQLYELHRLYQVQRSLMAESERKGPATCPQSDPPSSNSSLLSDPDSSKDANNTSKVCVNRQLYFPGQIDVNKPCEGFEQTGALVTTTQPRKERPAFDLELPPEEYMDEIEEDKSFTSQGRLLQRNVLDRDNNNMDNIGIALKEAFGNNRNSSYEPWGQNHFLPNLSESKEVKSFSMAADFSFQASTTLGKESTSSSKLQAEENKQQQPFDVMVGQKNTREFSKLPHWLLQVPSHASKNTEPSKLHTVASSNEQQTAPSFTSRHDAASQSRKVVLFPGERVESSPDFSTTPYICQTSLHQGQVWQTEFPRVQLPVTFPNATLGSGYNVQKTAQVMNENLHLAPYSRNDISTCMSPARGSNFSSSPSMDARSAVFENHAASNIYSAVSSMKENAGVGGNNDAPIPLWAEQKGSSSIVQQSGGPNQRSFYGSSNLFHAIANEVQSTVSFNEHGRDAFAMQKADDIPKILEILSPPPVTKQEVVAGRGIKFDSSGCELPVSFGLKMKGLRTMDTLMVGPLVHRHGNVEKSDMAKKEIYIFGQAVNTNGKTDRLNLVRNNFDLNVQGCEDLAEEEIHPYCKHDHRMDMSPEWCSRIESKASYSENLNVEAADVNRELGASDVASAVTHLQNNNHLFSKDVLENSSPDMCFYGGNDVAGHFIRGRSSDGSGLTSCESREAATITLVKSRDDSNTSTGDQSGESRVPCQSVMAFSSNMHSEKNTGLQPEDVHVLPSTMFNPLVTFQHNRNEEVCCTDMVIGDTDLDNMSSSYKSDAWEAAMLLLTLGSDFSSMMTENDMISPEERSLKWFADIVRQEENCVTVGVDANESPLSIKEGGIDKSPEFTLVDGVEHEQELDSFESEVLRLKPVDPYSMKLSVQPLEIPEQVEESPPQQNLRRRSSRRGKANKDFQKDVLPSLFSLSRQEVTEDLQIIEGLIKSSMDTAGTGRPLLSPKEEGSLFTTTTKLELSSIKNSSKSKGNKACRVGKQKGILRVCSWGESTRRKRMRRQRSQWLCLPPGV